MGGCNSSKDGDSCFVNERFRSGQGEWPCLVIEAAL